MAEARPLRDAPLVRSLVYYWETLLSARGRYLLVVAAVLALVGADTNRTQAFRLFALAAAALLPASLVRLWPRPRVRLDAPLPERATAGRTLPVFVTVISRDQRPLPGPLRVFARHPRVAPVPVTLTPPEQVVDTPEASARLRFELRCERRGRYELRGPGVARLDPLGLASGFPLFAPGGTLLVHPRFERLEEFSVPVGRRYQPGGIPLTSSTGDAIEFVGTREYRPGDPLKHIHWRSWARRGEPVVKEFQEEYFCRIALVLDTFLPKGFGEDGRRAFEAALSLGASVADVFSRSEYIVDVLAAGPDLYEVSAGRSLAYLENILDVLACLEPCQQPPFETVGPALFDKLAQTTTVVAVLLDWDDARAAFLRRVGALGVAVRGVIVRDGPTSQPWQAAAGELNLSLVEPRALEERLRHA